MRAPLFTLLLLGCDFGEQLVSDIRNAPQSCESGTCREGTTCTEVHPAGRSDFSVKLCLSAARALRAQAATIHTTPTSAGTAPKRTLDFSSHFMRERMNTSDWVENPRCTLGPAVRDLSQHKDVRMLGTQWMPRGPMCLYACSCGYNEHVPGKCPEPDACK